MFKDSSFVFVHAMVYFLQKHEEGKLPSEFLQKLDVGLAIKMVLEEVLLNPPFRRRGIVL